ncbi:MAG: hypothetical protein EHM28_05445 [Spirochaetaceae bacterium]|nr:MAG: hypothetical protein EHM28_05445 [Spirochaetaceae bacterium]
MAHLREQVFKCEVCDEEADFPVCCGRPMEFDGLSLFCPICGRETKKVPVCCSQQMSVQSFVRNIKNDIFNKLR